MAAAIQSLKEGNSLQLLIPGPYAGRIIGRQGIRVQEVQQRTNTRVRLTDHHGSEKLVRIMGAWDAVETAASLVLQYVLRPIDEEKADALLMQCKQPPVSIILPEEVTTWLQSDAGRTVLNPDNFAAFEVGSMSGSGISDYRVKLQGGLKQVREATLVLSQQLRRHLRWAKVGAAELATEVYEVSGDVQPSEGFYSTENFRLDFPSEEGAVGLDAVKAFCEEVQDDTGAIIRVSSTDAATQAAQQVVIAGQYGAKMRALHEIALLLAHHSRQVAALKHAAGSALEDGSHRAALAEAARTAPCGLKFLLPVESPGAMQKHDVKKCAEDAGATSSASQRGTHLVVKLTSPNRMTCCMATLNIHREMECRAWRHEKEHGPPPLLIDYLARWGQSGKEDLARRRLGTRNLPLQQIRSCERLRWRASGGAAVGSSARCLAEDGDTDGAEDDSLAAAGGAGPPLEAGMLPGCAPRPSSPSAAARVKLRRRLAAFGVSRTLHEPKRRRRRSSCRPGRGPASSRRPAKRRRVQRRLHLANPLRELAEFQATLALEEEGTDHVSEVATKAKAEKSAIGSLLQDYSDDDDDQEVAAESAAVQNSSSDSESVGGGTNVADPPLLATPASAFTEPVFDFQQAAIASPTSPADGGGMQSPRSPGWEPQEYGNAVWGEAVGGAGLDVTLAHNLSHAPVQIGQECAAAFVPAELAPALQESNKAAEGSDMLEACRRALLSRLASL